MFAGIVLGLGAAFWLAVSYLFSRVYVLRRRAALVRLLVLGHVVMGLLAASALPLLWPASMPALTQILRPLLAATIFYVLGQLGLFYALRHAEASRVSPLLGIKIPILALIATAFFSEALSPLQWSAVGLSALAAGALAAAGGRISLGAAVAIIFAAVSYCLSDLGIGALVAQLSTEMSRTRAILLSVCLCYTLSGIAAMATLPWAGKHNKGDWRFALPWSLAWFGAMICLFACFGLLAIELNSNSKGVLYGNILQSTRGIMSVGLGALVARSGFVHLEQQISRGVLVSRVCAAVLMSLAIALYALGVAQTANLHPEKQSDRSQTGTSLAPKSF